jgi:branched-chain amino acid transport system substrate-binding protein
MNLFTLFLIIIGTLLVVGCATPSGRAIVEPQIRLGAIIHLTANDYSSVGQAFREGIDLAVAEQNALGGIDGNTVVVVYEDSQYDMAQVATATNKFIDIDAVAAAMISTATEVNVAGPMFEQRHVPIVNLWDSSKEIEDMGEYVFGIGGRTESAGASAADYAYSGLGMQRVILVNNNAQWSISVSRYFRERFEELGGVVVDEHSLAEGDTDFRTTISKISNTDHDGLFVPLSTHTDLFFRQLKVVGYDKPVIASDQVTQQTIDAAGDAAEGTYHTVLLLPEGARTEQFNTRYEQHYGKTTDQLLYVGLGYDGAKTLMRAIELGGTDRTAIKDAMYRVKDLDGAFSTISIDENGSYSRYERVVQVRNGKDALVDY